MGFLKIDVSTKLFHNLFSEISISDLSCITILSEQDKIIYATNEATGKTFLDAYLSNPDSSGEEKKKIYYTMNEDYIRNMLSRIEEELLGK